MYPQSPLLTIGSTVLKESNVLSILGVTFDSRVTFSLLGFHSSFSKAWYLKEVLVSISW